jgi:TPR repeat protein
MPSELTEAIDFTNSAPEFYMVLGMRDLATHIATVRDTYGRINAKGYHLIYREIDDLGARTYNPPTNDDAIAWATRLRNKNIAPSAAEAKLLNAPQLLGAAGYFESLALVGGAPAGVSVQKLLASKDAAVRAAAAETCRHAIFGEETTAVLGKALWDPEAKVRRAALGALAMYAGWRSEAAQKALIDLATHPEKAVEPVDRISAVDGLGFAVRFEVRGVRQDPPVFRALVSLLADKDEEIRVMAANILAPVRDGDFRGDAGRPEKKAPEGGWAKWLDDITAKEAGYAKDYEVCSAADKRSEAVEQFCNGGAQLKTKPALAFQNTMKAAEQGYVPAEAALGMMYANGKGVQQDYVEAGKWWSKAAAGGHVLAAANAARAPKVPVPGAIPQ